jgi:hypothetical protein
MQFRDIIADLKVKTIGSCPASDAAADWGAAYRILRRDAPFDQKA